MTTRLLLLLILAAVGAIVGTLEYCALLGQLPARWSVGAKMWHLAVWGGYTGVFLGAALYESAYADIIGGFRRHCLTCLTRTCECPCYTCETARERRHRE
jgi:hypothetical protein